MSFGRRFFGLWWLAFWSANLPAENIWVVGTQGDDAAVAAEMSQLPGAQRLPIFYTLYENGTTHVRFEDPEKPIPEGAPEDSKTIHVGNDPVVIVFPENPTPDSLMQVLVMARLAHLANASAVSVVAARPLDAYQIFDREGQTIGISIESLLATAGVDSVKEFGQDERRPEEELLHKVSRPPAHHHFVLGDAHPELRDKVAAHLGIPAISEADLDSLPPQSQIFLVSPSLPPVNTSFFRNLALLRKLRAAGIRVQYCTTYLPYDRLDKSAEGRLAVDLLESVDPSSVSFVQAHAEQSVNFFRVPRFAIDGVKIINQYFRSKGVTGMASPDNGYVKTATRHCRGNRINPKKRLVILNKERIEGVGVQIVGHGGGDVEGQITGLADDQTISGETLGIGYRYLKDVLKVKDFPLVVVTHLVGMAKLFWKYAPEAKLVVLDTLPVPAELKPKVIELTVSEEIARVWRPFLKPVAEQVTRSCIMEIFRQRTARERASLEK